MMQNPLAQCECIPKDDFKEIFDHGRDSNCKEPETWEPKCARDEEFDKDICECVKTETCWGLNCYGPGLIADPISKCKCISVNEFVALYTHGLDKECKPQEGN